MNSLVIGASSGLGRALAQELAARGHRLLLVSSDARDLEPLCADLNARFGERASHHALDLADFDPESLCRAVRSQLGSLDALFFVAGAMSEEPTVPISDSELVRLVRVNALAGMRLVNAFLPELRKSPRGNCVGIGSVAAVRAREANLAYASSKAALEFYFQGIRHTLVGSSCRVQFYRLGYMKSGMTHGKRLLLPAADPAAMAKKIADNLDRDSGIVYLPFWWRFVMSAYRCLPWAIYKHLKIR